MISETLEHQLRIARASALTMRVLYLRRLAERLRWLVQQTEETLRVQRSQTVRGGPFARLEMRERSVLALQHIEDV